MAAPRVSLGALKEPLGLNRALQWFFSIFAFATCGGFEGSVTFRVTCAGAGHENHSVTARFAYPFRLNEAVFEPSLTHLCNHTWPKDVHLVGDFSSASRFFVGVAVVAFLYSLGALGLYLGYLHLYRCAGSRLPIVVSAQVCSGVPRCAQVCSGGVTWATCTCTGARGPASRSWTCCCRRCWPRSGWWPPRPGPRPWDTSGPPWPRPSPTAPPPPPPARAPGPRPWAGWGPRWEVGAWLNEAFGFLNLLLWAGGSWFVYKETPWHRPATPPDPAPSPM
ncbi:synaptophysin-like protein 1 [Chamaea fasciata]|uniref:synaptophysin-like protein 1 n=1 Tax=Chamaea fasciata TaxID=190680 RepID=UPI003369E01E